MEFITKSSHGKLMTLMKVMKSFLKMRRTAMHRLSRKLLRLILNGKKNSNTLRRTRLLYKLDQEASMLVTTAPLMLMVTKSRWREMKIVTLEEFTS